MLRFGDMLMSYKYGLFDIPCKGSPKWYDNDPAFEPCYTPKDKGRASIEKYKETLNVEENRKDVEDTTHELSISVSEKGYCYYSICQRKGCLVHEGVIRIDSSDVNAKKAIERLRRNFNFPTTIYRDK